MASSRVLLKVPRTARRGEDLRIRTLIRHRMETGLRSDHAGEAIERHIVNRFLCRYDDAVVFDAELHPAVAANPYIEFHVVASHSGRLSFLWFEDGGKIYSAQREITVI